MQLQVNFRQTALEQMQNLAALGQTEIATAPPSTEEVWALSFLIAILVLETFMIGVFCSLDLVIFYLFFEGGLIPMFLIIGVWGGSRRVYSAFKFFLFTLLGSVLMLVAIISIYWITGTTDVIKLLDLRIEILNFSGCL